MKQNIKHLLAALLLTTATFSFAQGLEAQHDLMGKWVLTWLETNNKNMVTIRGVETRQGYTDLEGVALSGAESCPLNASVMDKVTVIVPRPGPPKLPDAAIPLQAFVGVKINCADIAVDIVLLGSPSRKTAMVGRATVSNKRTGVVTLESVVLGREQ